MQEDKFSLASVVHITSAHKRYDARIFIKECQSLAAAGYRVSLLVADGLADETINSIDIFSVPTRRGRVKRFFQVGASLYKKALALNADIYHLHDPELMFLGLKLKSAGKVVVLDAHEDLPKQLLNKSYLSKTTAKLLAAVVKRCEAWLSRKFDAIVTATPLIREKFERINSKVIEVANYPILEDVGRYPVPWDEKQPIVCYVGGVARTRGVYEAVAALKKSKFATKMIVAGICRDESLRRRLDEETASGLIDYRGYLDRAGVAKIFSESMVGLVTLHDLPNYKEALPVKLFEYMGAGIPVIASDFPLWKDIVEKHNCGVCLNPYDIDGIARVIDQIISNPEWAKKMGDNGKKAVEETYNWQIEQRKLRELYKSLLKA